MKCAGAILISIVLGAMGLYLAILDVRINDLDQRLTDIEARSDAVLCSSWNNLGD